MQAAFQGLYPRFMSTTESPSKPEPAGPLYQRVADDLIARIRGGEHAVGAMLPTEVELCAAYGVSRHTVREALRLLENMGLVLRRQGAGTIVTARETRDRFVQEISSAEELMQYPENTRLLVLRARSLPVDPAMAAVIGCAPDETWLRVEGIRRVRVTAAPLCYTTLHIPPEYAEVLDAIGNEAGPVYALIERRFGLRVGRVELDIAAATVPAEQAALLEVEPGSAALLIRRRYIDGHGRVFEVSESCHPAPRFTYRLTLRRAETAEG
jgi:DNA-binding GntR family transcriptional regulator